MGEESEKRRGGRPEEPPPPNATELAPSSLDSAPAIKAPAVRATSSGERPRAVTVAVAVAVAVAVQRALERSPKGSDAAAR